MVIFSEVKYKTNTKVLGALELVMFVLGEAQTTSIGLIQCRECERSFGGI